ncbi:MAG: 2-amino-4-hydroxy-6-hydroxymethyldihydropteridine diphosphokinase [Candidatus Tectimicrobiota bacterium]
MSQAGVLTYLGLGSNLGDRTQHLVAACRTLRQHPAITLDAVSSLYHTAPVGVTTQDWFLNAVVRVRTTLAPQSLLCVTQATERRLGRVLTYRWGPRVLDIDILLYDAMHLQTPTLTIPHAALQERRFVLVPLAELAPDLHLPSGQRVQDLLAALPEAADVQHYGPFPSF